MNKGRNQGGYLIRGGSSQRHRLVSLVAYTNEPTSLFLVWALQRGRMSAGGGVPGVGLTWLVEGLRAPFQLCRLLLWRSTTGHDERPTR